VRHSLVEHRQCVVLGQVSKRVGGGARASCVHQIDEGTGLAGEADALVPHFGIATERRLKGFSFQVEYAKYDSPLNFSF